MITKRFINDLSLWNIYIFLSNTQKKYFLLLIIQVATMSNHFVITIFFKNSITLHHQLSLHYFFWLILQGENNTICIRHVV